jgi:hypothetical protein
MVEVEGGGRQVAVVVAAAKERCRTWREKVGSEGRRGGSGALKSSGEGAGSSSSSSSSSSRNAAAVLAGMASIDMSAMD